MVSNGDLQQANEAAQRLGSTLLFHCLSSDILSRSLKYRNKEANHTPERVKELLAMALGSMMAVEARGKEPAS